MVKWERWMDEASQRNDKVINMLLTLYLDKDVLEINSWEKSFIQDNINRLKTYTNRFIYTAKQEQKIKDIYINAVNEVWDEALWEGMVEGRRHLEQMKREAEPIKELPIPGSRTTLEDHGDEDDIPF